jgi:predicted ABC-type ATPase
MSSSSSSLSSLSMEKSKPCIAKLSDSERIVEDVFRGKIPYKPNFILTYGVPGSGKSMIRRQFISERKILETQVISLSIDDIVSQIPGFEDDIKRMGSDISSTNNDKRRELYFYYRSNCGGDHIFRDILHRALQEKYDIFYETTGMSIIATQYFIDQARRLGYHTMALVPILPVDVAIERVDKRQRTTGQVPADEKFIRESWIKSQTNLITLFEDLDEIIVYNSEETPPTQMAKLQHKYTYDYGKNVKSECSRHISSWPTPAPDFKRFLLSQCKI